MAIKLALRAWEQQRSNERLRLTELGALGWNVALGRPRDDTSSSTLSLNRRQ